MEPPGERPGQRSREAPAIICGQINGRNGHLPDTYNLSQRSLAPAGRLSRTRMSSPHSRDPRVEQSLRYSVRDGVAYSTMAGAGESFFAAYALFLKAGAAHVSLLTALPSLLGSISQLVSAWAGRYFARRKTLMIAGVAIQLASWLPIIWLPYFFPQHALPILIVAVAIYYTGFHLASPMWSSLMGDLVPEARRGRFFARRTRLMSITSFVTMLTAGGLLHYFEVAGQTRMGFMLVFTVAALARAYSLYQLSRMHEPPHQCPSIGLPPPVKLLSRVRHSPFARFTLFFALFNLSVAITSPLFAVYMLRDLNFTYVEYTLSTGMSVLMQFLALGMWGRITDSFGNRVVLVVIGAVIPILPALWLLSGSLGYILLLQMAGGLCWAGFSLAASNYLYDTVVPEKRAAYLAVHNFFSNGGIFLGALLGGFLASVLPAGFTLAGHDWQWASSLWAVMLISALARGVIAALFLPGLPEVRRVRPIAVLGVVSRLFYARHLRAIWLRQARARSRTRPVAPTPLSSTGQA